MRILLVTGQKIMGGEYHRLIVPHSKMHFHGHEVSQMASIDHVPESQLSQFDLIIASRSISRIGNEENVWKILKRLGIPVIIDTDDHYQLSDSHVLKKEWKLNHRAEALIYNFSQADAIMVTTPYLKYVVSQFNKNVEVFPNTIDFEQPQFIPNPEIKAMKSELVNIGWSGSVTHLEDLQLIEGEILSLNKSSFKDYKFMLAGFYEGDSIWHKYEKIFTSNYILDDNNYGRINAADVYSYAQAYNLMDIGLIPLRYNEFNRAKSELKMLEMGAFGLGVIVSDVESYQWMSKHGKNCLVAGKKDWYKSMRRLIENPELRKDLGSQLKEDVMQNSNEALWRKYRMEYYESIISNK
jgi:glycosyltransferase involved in cell wall biosynthesis